jgi:serine/threonine-protein kinase
LQFGLFVSQADEYNELEGVPEPGEIIVGKYRIEHLIGLGGMGCVVAATHLGLEQRVAIKFLLARYASNAQHVMRFEREAKAAARLKSDHVAKVLDVGVLPSGTPYMVMELLEGEDLAARLQQGPLPLADAADILLEASEGLAEAHRAGIVHRDLKPGNLFLAQQSDGSTRVKVLDFGISKIVDGPGTDLTKTSTLMGSPLYMSPEQMMSAKGTDARSDIWALGCILFECVSGRPPFLAETLPEVCSLILTSPPAKLRELAPHLPIELEAAIERALVKLPEDRYADLGEMAAEVAPFAGARGRESVAMIGRMLGRDAPPSHESLPPPTPPAQPMWPSLVHAHTAAPVAQTMPVNPPSHKAIAIAGAVLLSIAAIGTLALSTRIDRDAAPASAPQPSVSERSESESSEPAVELVPATPIQDKHEPVASASASASAAVPVLASAPPVRKSPPPKRQLRVKPGDSLFNTP